MGLGNPGRRYARNRHNVGFQCLSRLARSYGLAFRRRRHQARLAAGWIAGQEVVLAQPLTFMNQSGLAVRGLVGWLKLSLSDLLVIYDDLDLPLGTLRLRPCGSAGGHRGVQSIIEALGSESFPRLRVGIGRPPPGQDPVDFVLSDFWPQEEEAMAQVRARVAEAVECFLREGLAAAMNKFHVG